MKILKVRTPKNGYIDYSIRLLNWGEAVFLGDRLCGLWFEILDENSSIIDPNMRPPLVKGPSHHSKSNYMIRDGALSMSKLIEPAIEPC